VNFTWWVNREDALGNNLFEGGFLGLDNIGPIDRSHLPPGTVLEQSDATGWMAFYAISMGKIAGVLWRNGRKHGGDLVLKFLEHYAGIAEALEGQSLWDEAEGMFYDHLLLTSGAVIPVTARSMVGVLPAPLFASRFDESRFLSPYGLRSLSAVHRDNPYVLHLDGTTATIDYEPAESTTGMFGGNSNWRGPVWFPLNYLVVSCLLKYHSFFGDDFTVEYPTGSGNKLTLAEIADDLRGRLISLFTRGADGRRPCYGWVDKLQHDPKWRDNIYFNEYYHGDNAAGLGASHQTGGTGLIADVIRRRYGAVPETADLIHDALYPGDNA